MFFKKTFYSILCLAPLLSTLVYGTGNTKVFQKYLNNYFVETGTCRGKGIKYALQAGFQEIRSIELSTKLYLHSKKVFKNNPNVKIWLGDSAYRLTEMIVDIEDNITFWLDGHYSQGITAKGETYTPLLKELNQISQHPIKTHTILIDDVRCIGTKEFDYIELDRIISKIYEINPNYNIRFEDGHTKKDILVAYIPGKST